jgi:hypothetical protein
MEALASSFPACVVALAAERAPADSLLVPESVTSTASGESGEFEASVWLGAFSG